MLIMKMKGDIIMNVNYPEVPNIISGKDLDYLKDMFEWNCSAYKKAENCKNQVQDPEIRAMIEKAGQLFSNHATTILSILRGGQNE